MVIWLIVIIACPKICLLATSNVPIMRMLTHEEQQAAQRQLLDRFVAADTPPRRKQTAPRFFTSNNARRSFLSSLWQQKPYLQHGSVSVAYLFSSAHLDHVFRAGVALFSPGTLNPDGQLHESRMVVGEDVDILKRVQGKHGEWWTGNFTKTPCSPTCLQFTCNLYAAATLDVAKIRHISASEARSRFQNGFSIRIRQLNKRWPSCVNGGFICLFT